MHAYGIVKTCPKCGGKRETFTVKFIEEVPAKQAHLVMTCECGTSWEERVKDAPPE